MTCDLHAELKVVADRPTMAEWLDDVAALPKPEHPSTPAAEVLADERKR